MKIKRFEVPVKYAETETGTGYIEGYASTWDRVPDAYGDIVAKGAFTSSLERFKESGKSIPLLWAHKMDELDAYIGTCVAEEDEKGLHFTANFDETDEAQRIRQLYKDGRLSKFSFAYNTLDECPVELEDGVKANELRELDIFEISCVLVPANGFAEVLDVKSGRRNSAKDLQALKDVIDILQSLVEDVDIDKVDSENNDDDNAGQAKDQAIINEKKSQLLSIIEKLYI